MSMALLSFLLLALVAIVTALGMLLARNAVYSAIFLVLNFITIAVFYLLLGAPFLAVAQVAVYAGAIMVLFMFVIMLLGPATIDEKGGPIAWQRPVAVVAGLVLLGEMGYLLFGKGWAGQLGVEAATVGSPRALGIVLFREYLLPFEVTSVLLLVAMVGAIVLAWRERRRPR